MKRNTKTTKPLVLKTAPVRELTPQDLTSISGGRAACSNPCNGVTG